MSTKVMETAWQQSASEGGRLLVLVYLAHRANQAGECWPSITAIAHSTKLSPRHVKRILRELETDGEIAMPPGARTQGNPFRVTPTSRDTGVTGDIEFALGVTSEGEGGVTLTRAQEEPTAVEPTTREPTTRVREIDRVADVWAYYLAKLPSRRQLGAKQRRQITNALKVRSIDEIKLAIDGLAASPHHNGINDRNTKYLELHYAIVPRGVESTEERIDKAISWNQRNVNSASMEEHTRDRLLEEVRFTQGLPHHPEAQRAEDAVKQLEAAGFKVTLLDALPWARLER